MTNRIFHLYQYAIPVDSQLILRNRFLKKREGLFVQIKWVSMKVGGNCPVA